MRLFRSRRRQRNTTTMEILRRRRPHRHRARATNITTTSTLAAVLQAVPTVVMPLLLHRVARRLHRRARSTRATMADSRSFIRQPLAHRLAKDLSLRQYLSARVLQVSPAQSVVLRARATAAAPQARHRVVVHQLARMLRLPVAAAKQEATTARAVVTVAVALRVAK